MGAAEESFARWEQGSLLPAEWTVLPILWAHPDEQTSKSATGAATSERRRLESKSKVLGSPVLASGPAKTGSRMMVISQSCDLVKPAQSLPQVEVARVFTSDNPTLIAQSQDFGSARYFRLDRRDTPEALVLDFGQRAFIDKGFLLACAPDDSAIADLSPTDRKLLARWLGQRHSRPAVPDEDYELITRPVRDAWAALLASNPDNAQVFNEAYAEWRYRREHDGALTIYILSREPEPDEIVALELIDFLVSAIQPGYPGTVTVASDHRSYHTFTIADELATEQISMEWASHDEDGDSAALPS